MHAVCWCCRSKISYFASTCGACGHRVWMDRAVDLLIAVGAIVSYLILRKLETSVP